MENDDADSSEIRAKRFCLAFPRSWESYDPALAHATAQIVARGVGRARTMGVKRCSHGREKRRCVVCDLSPHGKVKRSCAECKGCPRGKLKQNCVVCIPRPHGKLKKHCADCNGCPHGKLKNKCAECKTARSDPPSSKRIKREPESSPQIKQEPNIKQ